MQLSDFFITKLKVHAVFSGERGAPKPSLTIEDGGDPGHTDLHLAVARLIKLSA
jgi:hypothetical protein